MAETSAPASVPELDAAFEELNASVDRIVVTMDLLRAERDALRAALQAVVAVSPYRGLYHCFYCRSNVMLGHETTCVWKLATAALALAARPD